MREIKGVIYDLDGTLIRTEKLHEAAWLYAGAQFRHFVTNEMLLKQKGTSNEVAAEMMGIDKNIIPRFVAAKVKYVMENISQVTLFPGVIDVVRQLRRKKYKVWIATSAHRDFGMTVFKNLPDLKRLFEANTVWWEDYQESKPSPKCLNVTIKKMKLTHEEVFYVGDAASDYKTALNANVDFIYFCPNLAERDFRIFISTPIIFSHREIWRWL